MYSARSEFPADARSVGEARKFVRRTLSSWGAEDLEFEASLVISELVSNSVIHARSAATVELDLDGGELKVAVIDGSTRAPRRKTHGVEAATGRGLALVEACSHTWGVKVHPHGKTVWAVLRPGGGTDAGRDGADRHARPGPPIAEEAAPPPGPGWQLRLAGPEVLAA